MKSIVLFRCCDAQTPLAGLRARRRWADWTITSWLASGVAMVEAMAALLLFGPSTFEVVLVMTSTVVCLLTAIPAIILMPVVEELERELSARGALAAEYVPVANRLERYVGKMLLFVILIGVVIAFVH